MMRSTFLSSLAALLLSAPGVLEAACTYEANQKAATLKWTGYKTPKKVGVSGKFTSIELGTIGKGPSVMEAAKGLSFDIDVNSLVSGDKVRDVRIMKVLLLGTENITGTVQNIADSTIDFLTQVNGQSKVIKLKYTIKENKLSAEGYFDILDFALQNNFKNFATACAEKHEGKSWSDVFVNVTVNFKKQCT